MLCWDGEGWIIEGQEPINSWKGNFGPDQTWSKASFAKSAINCQLASMKSSSGNTENQEQVLIKEAACNIWFLRLAFSDRIEHSIWHLLKDHIIYASCTYWWQGNVWIGGRWWWQAVLPWQGEGLSWYLTSRAHLGRGHTCSFTSYNFFLGAENTCSFTSYV